MFTSYAQNFEDVILWRALKSVERGFYIDIGAQDPVEDSVSLSFYEQGWRGVHVEPTATYAAKIRAARPDEEVIEAAIGTDTGLLTFHEFPGTGLSTGDPAIAKQHVEAGLKMKERLVPLVSLQNLLDRHAEREVHWLKIDVEGMESAVIESWGASAVRPWIVVVESTLPLSTEKSHAEWQSHLKGLGYEFVYFDGLNRFYVSEKHPELRGSFGPGPNYFDEFAFPASSTSHMLAPMRQQLSARNKQLADKQAAIEERDAEAARLSESIATLAQQVQQLSALTDALQNSTSWRLTAPLRRLKRMIGAAPRWPKGRARRPAARTPKANAKLVMQHGLLWLRRRPRVAAFAQRVVRLAPPLQHRLLAFARASSGFLTLDTGWTLEPDPVALGAWRKRLTDGKST